MMMTEAFTIRIHIHIRQLSHSGTNTSTYTAAPSVLCSGHLNHSTLWSHSLLQGTDVHILIDIKSHVKTFLSATLFYLPSPLTVPSSALLYVYVLCVFVFIYIKWFSPSLSLYWPCRVYIFVCIYSENNVLRFFLFQLIHKRWKFNSDPWKFCHFCHFRYIWLVKCIRSLHILLHSTFSMHERTKKSAETNQ